jgi:hypothetical protein
VQLIVPVYEKKNIPFTHTSSLIKENHSKQPEVTRYTENELKKNSIKDSVLAAITDITRTPKKLVQYILQRCCCNKSPTLTEQIWFQQSLNAIIFYFSHGTMGMSGSLLLLFNTHEFRNVYTASSSSLFWKSQHLQKICIGHKMCFTLPYHFYTPFFTTTNNYWVMFEVHAETHVGLNVKW